VENEPNRIRLEKRFAGNDPLQVGNRRPVVNIKGKWR
jgi:hypothetical protein